jgi:hypothetical protein
VFAAVGAVFRCVGCVPQWFVCGCVCVVVSLSRNRAVDCSVVVVYSPEERYKYVYGCNGLCQAWGLGAAWVWTCVSMDGLVCVVEWVSGLLVGHQQMLCVSVGGRQSTGVGHLLEDYR